MTFTLAGEPMVPWLHEEEQLIVRSSSSFRTRRRRWAWTRGTLGALWQIARALAPTCLDLQALMSGFRMPRLRVLAGNGFSVSELYLVRMVGGDEI